MPDPNQNQIQTPEQIAAANPPAAPQPIPQYNPEDAVTGVVGDYLKGIRARVIAPVEQSIKKIASNPKVAPFVAAADAAVGGPAVRAAAQTPQGKSVTQAVSNFSKNPILNLAEQAKGSMMGSELGPEGGILEDAAGNLLKNIRWRTAPEVKGDPFSHVPEAKPTEPVYRARPIGQEGVPSESHAQATASEPEARQYAQNLEEMTGKPHEVVRVDLNKVPADKYTRQPGPNGNDWVKFHEPVSEEHVEPFHEAGKVPDFIANAKEGVLKQDAPEAANVKKYVEDNGGVFRGMQVNQVGDKKIGQIYFDVPPDRVGGKTNVTAGVSLDKATPEGIKSSIDAMAAQHAPAVKAAATEALATPKSGEQARAKATTVKKFVPRGERSYDPNDYMAGDKLPRDGGYFLHLDGTAEPAPTHLLTALNHVPANSHPSPETAYMKQSGAVRVAYNGPDYLNVEAIQNLNSNQIKQITDMMKTHNKSVVYDLPSGSGEATTWLDFVRASTAKGTEGLSGKKIPKKFKQDATVKDNMNDPDTRFTAARHEAGHAVISEMLNPGSVDSMALTNRGGETNIKPPEGKQTVNQLSDDDIRNMVATSLAGGLSEPGGTTPKHSSSDMAIRNQVTGMRASTPGQNISRLVTGKVMGNDPMLAAPNVQAEAQARVNAILADPKMNRAIDGLAGKFNETGKMTGKQVREYLKNVK